MRPWVEIISQQIMLRIFVGALSNHLQRKLTIFLSNIFLCLTSFIPRCHEKASSYIPVSEMPSISIVFIFVDECLSVLLRSIVSIILTTPSELLHDIVLVDDASQKRGYL